MSAESTTDAVAVIETATRAAAPTVFDGQVAVFSIPAGGDLRTFDIESATAKYRERPSRKSGSFAAHDADSFVSYLAKHAHAGSEVWADVPSAKVVAVINAHEQVIAGWGDHRLTYSVQHTEAWKAWTAHDGKLLDQATFAEHIEERSIDIVRPTAADMLELAQTFQATIGVNFESSKLLSSGERQIEYRETVDAKAGKAGRLEIPKDFDLALVPFEGANPYKVRARFRFRLTDGQLRVGYRLERPTDVLREAFLEVVDSIATRVETPVFRGVHCA